MLLKDVSPSVYARHLRWVVLSYALAAVAEGLRGLHYFYTASDWRSASFEVVKLIVILAIVWMFGRKADAKNLAPLRASMLAMIISVLSDEAFFQALHASR